MPWIHMKEFGFCFQSLYMECSNSHNPVSRWCFLTALLWLVDGSEGINHFLYFSIKPMKLNHPIVYNVEDIPMFETLEVWTTSCDEDDKFQFHRKLLFIFYNPSTKFCYLKLQCIPHDVAQRKRHYSWKNDEHFERHLLWVLVRCGRK
jgi:hypothetical protein